MNDLSNFQMGEMALKGVKNKPRTIGVLGLGSIGMRHKTNLWKIMGQTEVAGYDPDPEKQNGTGWVVGDYKSFLEMCDPILICSPTVLHWTHICDCVMAGKTIFAEKPICTHDAHVIPQNVLMVGYNLRFHSCVKKAKSWMDRIGQPLWATFMLGQHSSKPPYLADGVIFNWSHEIDLALYLLGPAKVAASTARITDGKDDIADIALIHDDECRSWVHLDYVTSPEIRQFIIVGSQATIIVDLVNRHAWLRNAENIVMDQFAGKDNWNDNYIEEIQAFLDRCDGQKTLGCTGEEALEVVRICLAVRSRAHNEKCQYA